MPAFLLFAVTLDTPARQFLRVGGPLIQTSSTGKGALSRQNFTKRFQPLFQMNWIGKFLFQGFNYSPARYDDDRVPVLHLLMVL